MELSRKTEISIVKWVKHGGMLVNTECLEPDHPSHPYNQALAQGVVPEDFGLQHPLYGEFESRTRSQLIDEIISLRKEVMGYVRAGF